MEGEGRRDQPLSCMGREGIGGTDTGCVLLAVGGHLLKEESEESERG